MNRSGCRLTAAYSSGVISICVVHPAREHSQIAGMTSLTPGRRAWSFAMFSLTSRNSASFRPALSSQTPTVRQISHAIRGRLGIARRRY